MKNLLTASTFALFVFSQIIFSQTPTPTPNEIVEVEDVVKISTNLIQIDVTVTDQKGRPIKGLTAEDFEIYENGKKQKITGISFISPQNEYADKTDVENNSSFPVKQVKPDDVRRTIALVVNDLSLSFENIHHTRRTLRNFVDNQLQEGDLAAIIRTRGSVGILQQFTTDKRILNAAIDRLRWSPSRLGKILSFEESNPYGNIGLANGRAANPVNPDDFEISVPDESLDLASNTSSVTGTLGTMRAVIDGMKTLPGRKSMIFFSQGLSLKSDPNNFSGARRVLTGVDKLIEAANRASIVIYPIDTNGVPYNFNGFAGLKRLAKDTGGIVIFNTNDLKGGIRKILNDQSYYLVAYEPDEESFDPKKLKFNKIKVEVSKADAEVRYRRGFFGVADEIVNKPVKILTNNDKILTAVTSPFASNEINVNLSTNFKSDEKEDLFVNSYLHIKASDLTFTEKANGIKQAVFDIYVAGFDNSGIPSDQISKTFTIKAKGKTFENVMREGFVYYLTIPIKKAGAYQIRAAILDQATNKTGSASEFIEIPKISKNRLVLSGILLDNVSYKEWNANSNSRQFKTSDKEDKSNRTNTTSMTDTALRQFKRGTVLSYGLEIYNAKINSQKNSELQMRTRIFRDNQLIHEGKNTRLDTNSQKDSLVKVASGAMNLGTDMISGNYILQIIVTDKLAKKKRQIASQFVQFEIIE